MDLYDVLQLVLTLVLVIGIFALIAWINRSGKRNRQIQTDQKIRPNRLIFCTFAILCILLAAAAGYGAYYNYMIFRFNQVWLPAAISFVSLLGSFTLGAYIVSRAYDVCWDAKGLCGPGSYWFPPFGPGCNRIEFSEITHAGTDWGGSDCVWNAEGKVIIWSFFYVGYDQLMEQIALVRPDLFDEEDEFDEDL